MTHKEVKKTGESIFLSLESGGFASKIRIKTNFSPFLTFNTFRSSCQKLPYL